MAPRRPPVVLHDSLAARIAHQHLLFLVREAQSRHTERRPEGASVNIQNRRLGVLTVTYNELPRCCSNPAQCPLLYTTHVQLLDEITRRLAIVRGAKKLQQTLFESINKAVAQTTLVSEFYHDLGLDSDLSEQKIHLTSVLAAYAVAELSESYLKFKLSFCAAQALKQTELPTRPSFLNPIDRSDTIMGGAAYLFHRRCVQHLNLKYGQTASQLKKGAPAVSRAVLLEAAAKTVKNLTTRKAANDDLVMTVHVPQARRTAAELFPPGWYSKSQGIQIPSRSAHFADPRKEGGALGSLAPSYVPGVGIDPGHCSYSVPTPRTHVNKFLYWLVNRRLFGSPPVVSLWDDDLAPELPFSQLFEFRGYGIEVLRLRNVPREYLWRKLYNKNHNREEVFMLARPLALAEPFKVRTITMGPTSKYYRSKYIQSAVHTHLRRHPCAALIGEPLTSGILGSHLLPRTQDEFYVSGDYSAATDNLDPRVSAAIADVIAKNGGFHQEWATLFRQTLIEHNMFDSVQFQLDHPNKAARQSLMDDWLRGGDSEYMDSLVKPQAWGQLMGSPTSFPVLCIANLAYTRYSQELTYQRFISLVESGIIINGDDIGFVTTADGYEQWKKVTASGGLTPSLGKNFTSPDFIVLNSMMFKVENGGPNRAFATFTEIAYVNYGLLHGCGWRGSELDDGDLKAAMLQSVDSKVATVGSLARELIRGHPVDVQKDLLKRFISSWKPVFDRLLPRGMSYYLPPHLGGLGLPVVGEHHDKSGKVVDRFTRAQRVMASFLMHDPERQCELAQLGTSLKEDDSFPMWKKAMPLVKEYLRDIPRSYSKLRIEEPAVLGALRASCLAEVLCNGSVHLSPEGETLETEERYDAYRKTYEKLFDRCMRSTFPPATDDEIFSDKPWVESYHIDRFAECEDPSEDMDLRNPFPLPNSAPILERIMAA